jgi:hypothetical protein
MKANRPGNDSLPKRAIKPEEFRIANQAEEAFNQIRIKAFKQDPTTNGTGRHSDTAWDRGPQDAKPRLNRCSVA